MKVLPLSLHGPAIEAFDRGTLTRLRRPQDGNYRAIEPGDLLWIREPFHLARKFGGLSPTAAAQMGARPYFAATLASGDLARFELGRQRPARNLLKIWHRQHARVAQVERQQLRDITGEEAAAEGFTNRGAWARAWDRDVQLSGRHLNWDSNPEVLLLTLERVPTALPDQLSEGTQR